MIRRARRRAMSSLEAVLAFGVTFPICAALLFLAVRACVRLALVINRLVGAPYL